MSKVQLIEEVSHPAAPPAGRGTFYFKDGIPFYMADDGIPYAVENASGVLAAHNGEVDPHPQYLTQDEADALYSDLAHIHDTGRRLVVKASPAANEYSTIAAAIAAIGTTLPAASSTVRYVVQVYPGEYTEAPFAVPGYVYISGFDPWNSAVIKAQDLTNDFITVAPNGGLFNVAVSGPTTAGKSAIAQTGSGTTKIYWVNIKEGYFGITLAPVSGTARCHCIGVVTDGPTAMNRMFNCDNPAGIGVFILMQSGPMVTTWAGTDPAAVYLNSNGASPPRANATLDLCQFRGNAPSGQTLHSVYADNGALVRGICCSFAGATSLTNPAIAICSGPNPGTSYKTRIDIHGSQIKPGGYTKDIKIMHAETVNSYSGMATEANLDFVAGAQFNGSFSDSSFGQVVYGELYVGNTFNKTPLAAYVEANKASGVSVGGGLSRGAGARQVDIAAGSGFLDTANGLREVTWGATTITVAANSAKARIYVDSAGAIQQSPSGIDKTLNIQLGEVGTDADSVVYLFDQRVTLPHFRTRLYEYLEKVIGPINISGGIVTENATDLHLDATDSVFYVTEEENDTAGAANISFTYWYRDGAGGWMAIENQNAINTTQWDNGSGTLATLTAGKFRRDLLMVGVSSGGTEYHVIMGQAQFDTGGSALVNPIVPDVFTEHACRLAALVVEQGATALYTIEDQRPRLGQAAAGTSGITAHNDLTGRDSPTAHSQYQLASEKAAAGGYASLDGGGQVPVGQLGNVTHGNQAGGALHSAATTSANGFMAAADKQKLDGIATGATANSSDATLLARGNHTGAQAISTVTGLQAALDSKITGSRQVAVKAAAQSISANTLTDVTDLSVPVVAGTYTVKCQIVYQSTATGTGIAFSLNGPATSSLAMMKITPTSATAATVATANSFATVQASGTTTAANADQYGSLEAVITFSAGGTLQFRAASESAGTNISIRAGTTMFVEKVA